MSLTLNEYQVAASKTAIYPILGHPIVYPALGLNGEAGEVAEKVKKMCRDNNCEMTENMRQALIREAGDCLWYIAIIAKELGVSLEEVATTNIQKLEQRSIDGTLCGSGDDRGCIRATQI